LNRNGGDMRYIIVCVLLSAASVVASSQSIQKADFVYSVNSQGWVLAEGTGERYFIDFITFDKPYDAPPAVVLMLHGFDATTDKDPDNADKPESVRLYVTPEKITKSGFVIRLKTWGDSKLGAVWGTWMAWSK
jgi:hypothetical protein